LLQIVVVDGGSNDGSIEIVKKFESDCVKLIVLPGTSESEGQMAGITSSNRDVIMLTNSDIYVPPNWVQSHVAWLDKGFDVIGGKVFWGGDKYSLTWNMPKPKSPQFVQQQGLGLGFSNCSFRRSLLSSTGEFRNLKSQHDTEFAFRIVRSGKKMVLDPTIEVYHDHPLNSCRASFKRSFQYAFNHALVMRTSYGRIVTGSGAPAMLPVDSLIKEWLLINGIRAYRESLQRARENGISISLSKFLLIRITSTKLGQWVGVFSALVKRRVSLSGIANTHNQIQKN
jgi:glycosyltransferase involved in cell wall biosynthesis